MERHLRRFSDFIINHKVHVLVLMLAITVFFIYMGTKLTVNNDHDTWLPQHNEVARLLRQADRDFSSNVMLFAVIEFIGGIYPNSLAIIADAIHDLGDSVALGSAWLLERLSLKRGDRFFTYGYRRFSLLGAVISAGVISTSQWISEKTADVR